MEPDLHNLLFFFFFFFFFSLLFSLQLASLTSAANSNLFREYIGANFRDVTFSDVPINPGVQFHFILSFGIDYDTSAPPQPTNGKFNIFWDSANLSPSHVASIKSNHPNVKVGLSLGGWSVGGKDSNLAYFKPSTTNSWVSNAVTSLTSIIKQYGLDGIDIDYEHFQADPATFADCIGLLIQTLKNTNLISFASIAPFPDVENHYFALWKKYGHLIDYVNFQFYGYGKSTTVPQFLSYFRDQSVNYAGGEVLVSFQSDLAQGLTPKDGFFTACSELKKQGQLHGIFVWDADLSKSDGFIYEKQAQELLAQ